MQINLDPHEIQRQVELAFSLEATIPKVQCTSRYQDIGPKQKFEYFIISSINSGKYFFKLAERINESQGQPKVFYDLAYGALLESQKTREGKIVNYGLLEAMFPVVVARYVYGKDGYETLNLVAKALKNTSKEDVKYVSEMRKVIYSRSDKEFKKNFSFHENENNVFEHYEFHMAVAHKASKLFVEELITGMPLTKIIYKSLKDANKTLAERLNDGFNEARQLSALPYGALADFTAVALFLLIADNPNLPIV